MSPTLKRDLSGEPYSLRVDTCAIEFPTKALLLNYQPASIPADVSAAI